MDNLTVKEINNTIICMLIKRLWRGTRQEVAVSLANAKVTSVGATFMNVS